MAHATQHPQSSGIDTLDICQIVACPVACRNEVVTVQLSAFDHHLQRVLCASADTVCGGEMPCSGCLSDRFIVI